MMKALFYFFFANTFGEIFQAVSFMAEYSPWPIYMLITEVLPLLTSIYMLINFGRRVRNTSLPCLK